MLSSAEKRRLYMAKYEENRDYVDTRIREGIEQNRKGSCTLRITDKEGTPISGARIGIKQKTHAFYHGANIFMLDGFDSDELCAEYRRAFAEYFNLATVPFYWNTLEPNKGSPRYARDSEKVYRRPAPDLCMDYCAEKGIAAKLHCLFYDLYSPEWLIGMSEDEIFAEYDRRFSEISERYAGKMLEFEVVNELFVARNSKTPLNRMPNIAEYFFRLARKHFPADKLTINEAAQLPSLAKHKHYSPYYMFCENLILKGVPVDRIGCQYHLFTGVRAFNEADYEKSVLEGIPQNDPLMMFDALDTIGALGLPVELTEVTVPTFGDTIEDEELQADMLKLWYSVWFSHKAVDTIVYWNTADGYAYVNPSGTRNENHCRGGLFHKDMSPKLSAVMQKNLFDKEWHTEQTLNTDEGGIASFRGFKGYYTASINGREFSFTLSDSTDVTLTV